MCADKCEGVRSGPQAAKQTSDAEVRKLERAQEESIQRRDAKAARLAHLQRELMSLKQHAHRMSTSACRYQ
jgi:hypothetical protein